MSEILRPTENLRNFKLRSSVLVSFFVVVSVSNALSEWDSRTGKDRPEVVAVRNERSEVCTEIKYGQYFPVQNISRNI